MQHQAKPGKHHLYLAVAVLAHKACSLLQVGSITVQSYGDVTLLANAATAVALTAAVQPACATASTVPGSTSVFANLNAVELDVDAGEAFGLQVQRQAGKTATPAALQVGSNFTLDIRANSTSSPLIAFEVQSQGIRPCRRSELRCKYGFAWHLRP